jgi:uncharacterized protein
VSAVATDIQTGLDTFVPAFEVYVDKRRIGRELLHDVLSVSYRDDLDQIDSFELTVNNWDDDELTFKYSDGDLLLPGKRLELWLGYRGAGLHKMLTGVITGLTPSFPASGAPTLTVSGQNVLHELRKKRSAVRYHKRKESDIATEIAGRLGLKLVIDHNAKGLEVELEELLQNNEYDIVFLMRRARRLGYELLVEESNQGEPALRFRPSIQSRPAQYDLGYLGAKRNRVLLEFSPTFSTARQPSGVRVQGWSYTRKEPISVTVERDAVRLKDPAFDQATIRRAVAGHEEVISDRPVQDEAEGQRLGEQAMTRIKRQLIEASGRTVGLPDLRAGSVMHIDGVGKRFNGRYFVTGTEHTLGGSGYTTRFNCRREEV